MIKIIFVCHGNICRSTMAEFLFRHMAEQEGYSSLFSVSSRATSTEELGNPVHPGTRRVLSRLGIYAAAVPFFA
jgi:protein-tyrosine phosphatase